MMPLLRAHGAWLKTWTCDTFFGVTVKGDELIGDEQQPALLKQWKELKRRAN
jgi:hypothetical protein